MIWAWLIGERHGDGGATAGGVVAVPAEAAAAGVGNPNADLLEFLNGTSLSKIVRFCEGIKLF